MNAPLTSLAVVFALCTAALSSDVPWPFDMRVQEHRSSPEGVQVTTTGAFFNIISASGELLCQQRIGSQRPLATLHLPPDALRDLQIQSAEEDRVTLVTDAGLAITVHCDSVVELKGQEPLAVRLNGAFAPEYLVHHNDVTLALDDTGGLVACVFPKPLDKPLLSRSESGFAWESKVAPGQTFLLGICPPREYNWRQHATERIVHHFPERVPSGWSPRPLPTDEELEQWRPMGNILVLHLEFWDGFGVRHIRPLDPQRFREVIDRAHELGYLVLPYSSPYYYQPARKPDGTLRDDAVDLYMEEARWLLEEYGVDGLYWDGVFDDIPKAWECARRMRALLGSRRLYVHCTTTPLPWTDAYCPFVDTYADYLLRGEVLGRETVDPIYMRYVASGYNISNAIGELCYETCRLDPEMFTWALQANARIPYWPGLQVHTGKAYFLSPSEDRRFREVYLPSAAAITGPEQWAPHAVQGAQARQDRREALAAQRRASEAALAAYLDEQRRKAADHPTGNLAACKPTTCSDYSDRPWAPHGLGYLPVYATDENPHTYWGVDFAPQWLTVDLETEQAISSIRVITYFADTRFYHFRVETSTDGQNWELAGEKIDNSLSTAEGNLFTFPPRQARYVRVIMLHNSANTGLHIAELQVFP